MYKFRVQRYQMIEIPIVQDGTGNATFNIPDQPQLTGHDGTPVVIDSLVAYTADNFAESPVSGQTVVDAATVGQMNLNLYQGDLLILKNLPLQELIYVNPTAVQYSASVVNQFLLRNLINVSWTKSQINLVNSAATYIAGTVILLGVYYSVYPAMDFMVPSQENILLQSIATNSEALRKALL